MSKPNVRVTVDLELVVPDAKPDAILPFGVDDDTNTLIDDRIHEILEVGDDKDFIYTAVVGEPEWIKRGPAD